MSSPFLAISQHSLHRTLFCFVPNMVCRMSVRRNESAETIVRRLIETIFDCARSATSSVIDSEQLRTYCSNSKTIERFIAISPATNRNLIGYRLDLLFVHDEAHEQTGAGYRVRKQSGKRPERCKRILAKDIIPWEETIFYVAGISMTNR